MNLKKKRSFFDKLTGRGVYEEDELEYEEQYDDDDSADVNERGVIKNRGQFANDNRSVWADEQGDEGELSIDMYQTPDNIIIRTMIPGVKKEDLDIALSRDAITVRGKRMEESRIADENYYHQELYWGTFSRTVTLPHEVDIEGAEATEKDGVLTVSLPRIDKGRQTKLKVKSI